jgi:hemolysin activation/secretion protein
MNGLPPSSQQLVRRVAGTSLIAMASGLIVWPGNVAYAAPPSSGAIIQQTQLPAVPLSPPPAVLSFPAPNAQASQSNIKIPVSKLVIQGNQLLQTSKLHALVQPAEGQELTLGELRAYVDRITAAYKAAGYPLAYAYLPAQKVDQGVIKISIVEPNYDQIEVRGAKRLRKGTVLRTVGVRSGQPVAQAALDRGLLLLDQTPGVNVNGVLIPGAQPRTSSLKIDVHDQNLISGDVYTNNYGNRYTGAYLVGFDLSVNDPLGFGSSIGFNGMYAPGGHLQAAGFTINSPYIWNGLRAGVYGSYTNYRLGGSFKSLEQRGRANQLGADITYPIVLQPGRALSVRFDVLQSWLGQTTFSVGAFARQSITMERVSLSGVESDRFNGVTTASVAVTHGNVAIGDAQAKQADALGAKTARGYETVLIQIQRQQALPYGFSITPSVTAQLASKNLDSSQQIYLSGPYGVMGYPSGEGGGDDGYLGSVQLSHQVPLPARIQGRLDASLLAQTGTVWVNHNVYTGFTGHNLLTETGAGGELTYNWNRWSGLLAYSFQVGPTNPSGITTHGGQAWFQIRYQF